MNTKTTDINDITAYIIIEAMDMSCEIRNHLSWLCQFKPIKCRGKKYQGLTLGEAKNLLMFLDKIEKSGDIPKKKKWKGKLWYYDVYADLGKCWNPKLDSLFTKYAEIKYGVEEEDTRDCAEI